MKHFLVILTLSVGFFFINPQETNAKPPPSQGSYYSDSSHTVQVGGYIMTCDYEWIEWGQATAYHWCQSFNCGGPE